MPAPMIRILDVAGSRGAGRLGSISDRGLDWVSALGGTSTLGIVVIVYGGSWYEEALKLRFWNHYLPLDLIY